MEKWTKKKKKKGPQEGISDQKLFDCEHCCISLADERQRCQRLMWSAQWSSSTVPRRGTFHRKIQWPNTICGLCPWSLCEDSEPKSIVTDCQPFEPMLKGACLHILGPHEYIWNSMYLQINPQIVSAEMGKRKGLCWFYCICLRSPHPTHGEKFQRQRKQTWAN